MEQTKHCKVLGCRYAWSHVTMGHVCGQCKQLGHGIKECANPLAIEQLKNNSYYDTLPASLYCTVPGCYNCTTHQTSAHAHCIIAGDDVPAQVHVSASAPEPISDIIDCPLCHQKNQVPRDQPKVFGIDSKCVNCHDNKCDIYLPMCKHVCLCTICFNHLAQLSTNGAHCFWDGPDAPTLHFLEQTMGCHKGKICVFIPTGQGCSYCARRDDLGQPIETFFMHSDDWGQYGMDRLAELNEFRRGYQQIEK